MSQDLHARVKQLMLQAMIEGLAPAEEAWLREHQANCAECAREAAATQEAVQALRSVTVMAPRDLAARTQLRMRLRAEELTRATNGGLWVWIVAAASWLLGLFTAPLVWRVFAWAGGNFGVPKLALEAGFLLWWTVPALVAVGVVLYQRAYSAGTRGV
jgi:hypothetical protein